MTVRHIRAAVGSSVRTSVRASTWGLRTGVGLGVRRLVDLPVVPSVPEGHRLDLPGRGSAYVIDVPGPRPDSPTVVLLHGLATTAHLSWFTALGPLAEHHRVVALDLRWHGRGIHGGRFRVADCADDVAAVLDELGIDDAVMAGYSLGGAVAQELWRRHPDRVSGLVLCSTAARWRDLRREALFFGVLGLAMHPLSRVASGRVARRAAGLPDLPGLDSSDLTAWGLTELRSTSGWTLPEVMAELGRFDSRSWLGEVDVPTTVLVTSRDGAIPAERQRALGAAIPGAVVLDAPGGHASIFLDHARWVPLFLEAVASVTDRLPTPGRLAG
ncbi:alpha/beta fold hydrolase [Nocardioides sp.]|uniref:alpha/beta fold hydrolase n=1 Tax=Nocardioides sp. TaxID=35761 RepID=UPI00271B3E5F|nr:alpha/beta fold hydrolase [Nocardioides sp.]MDO9455778.1 alpha/beta fold hydrolase [Nocardioides sp.]